MCNVFNTLWIPKVCEICLWCRQTISEQLPGIIKDTVQETCEEINDLQEINNNYVTSEEFYKSIKDLKATMLSLFQPNATNAPPADVNLTYRTASPADYQQQPLPNVSQTVTQQMPLNNPETLSPMMDLDSNAPRLPTSSKRNADEISASPPVTTTHQPTTILAIVQQDNQTIDTKGADTQPNDAPSPLAMDTTTNDQPPPPNFKNKQE